MKNAVPLLLLALSPLIFVSSCGDDDPGQPGTTPGDDGGGGGALPTSCGRVQQAIQQRVRQFESQVDRPCQTDSDCIVPDPLQKLIADDDGEAGNDPGELCFSDCNMAILQSELGPWQDFLEDDTRLNQLCRRNLELECRVGQPSCFGEPRCTNNVCTFTPGATEPPPEEPPVDGPPTDGEEPPTDGEEPATP